MFRFTAVVNDRAIRHCVGICLNFLHFTSSPDPNSGVSMGVCLPKYPFYILYCIYGIDHCLLSSLFHHKYILDFHYVWHCMKLESSVIRSIVWYVQKFWIVVLTINIKKTSTFFSHIILLMFWFFPSCYRTYQHYHGNRIRRNRKNHCVNGILNLQV